MCLSCAVRLCKLHLAQGWSNRDQGGDGSGVGAQRATCGVCSAPLTGLSPYWSWNQTAGKLNLEFVRMLVL